MVGLSCLERLHKLQAVIGRNVSKKKLKTCDCAACLVEFSIELISFTKFQAFSVWSQLSPPFIYSSNNVQN